MTMMDGEIAEDIFVDTNILLRGQYETLEGHEVCHNLVEVQRARGAVLWINRQVIREYLVQATHPRTFDAPLTHAEVDSHLETILTLFRVADEADQVTDNLRQLVNEYGVSGKQVHDANIVATMLAYNIRTLITLNAVDFNRYQDKITIVTP